MDALWAMLYLAALDAHERRQAELRRWVLTATAVGAGITILAAGLILGRALS